MLNIKRFIRMYFEEQGSFEGIMDTNIASLLESEFKDTNESIEENLYRALGFEYDQTMNAKARYEFRIKYLDRDMKELKEALSVDKIQYVNDFASNIKERVVSTKVKPAKDISLISAIASYIKYCNIEVKSSNGTKFKVFDRIMYLSLKTLRVSISESRKSLTASFRKEEFKKLISILDIKTVVDENTTRPYIEDIGCGILHYCKPIPEKKLKSLIRSAIAEIVYSTASLDVDNRISWFNKTNVELINLAEKDTVNYLNYIISAKSRDLTVNQLAKADGMQFIPFLDIIYDTRCFSIYNSENKSVSVYPLTGDTCVDMSIELYKYLYERNLLETLYIDPNSNYAYIKDSTLIRLDSILV